MLFVKRNSKAFTGTRVGVFGVRNSGTENIVPYLRNYPFVYNSAGCDSSEIRSLDCSRDVFAFKHWYSEILELFNEPVGGSEYYPWSETGTDKIRRNIADFDSDEPTKFFYSLFCLELSEENKFVPTPALKEILESPGNEPGKVLKFLQNHIKKLVVPKNCDLNRAIFYQLAFFGLKIENNQITEIAPPSFEEILPTKIPTKRYSLLKGMFDKTYVIINPNMPCNQYGEGVYSSIEELRHEVFSTADDITIPTLLTLSVAQKVMTEKDLFKHLPRVLAGELYINIDSNFHIGFSEEKLPPSETSNYAEYCKFDITKGILACLGLKDYYDVSEKYVAVKSSDNKFSFRRYAWQTVDINYGGVCNKLTIYARRVRFTRDFRYFNFDRYCASFSRNEAMMVVRKEVERVNALSFEEKVKYYDSLKRKVPKLKDLSVSKKSSSESLEKRCAIEYVDRESSGIEANIPSEVVKFYADIGYFPITDTFSYTEISGRTLDQFRHIYRYLKNHDLFSFGIHPERDEIIIIDRERTNCTAEDIASIDPFSINIASFVECYANLHPELFQTPEETAEREYYRHMFCPSDDKVIDGEKMRYFECSVGEEQLSLTESALEKEMARIKSMSADERSMFLEDLRGKRIAFGQKFTDTGEYEGVEVVYRSGEIDFASDVLPEKIVEFYATLGCLPIQDENGRMVEIDQGGYSTELLKRIDKYSRSKKQFYVNFWDFFDENEEPSIIKKLPNENDKSSRNITSILSAYVSKHPKLYFANYVEPSAVQLSDGDDKNKCDDKGGTVSVLTSFSKLLQYSESDKKSVEANKVEIIQGVKPISQKDGIHNDKNGIEQTLMLPTTKVELHESLHNLNECEIPNFLMRTIYSVISSICFVFKFVYDKLKASEIENKSDRRWFNDPVYKQGDTVGYISDDLEVLNFNESVESGELEKCK